MCVSLVADWTALSQKLCCYPNSSSKIELNSPNSTHGLYLMYTKSCYANEKNLLILLFSGREQASLTGKRLQEFGYDYTHLIVSTMTRARETAGLIQESLPKSISLSYCSLLEEGAPVPPEPPVQGYSPKPYVSLPL